MSRRRLELHTSAAEMDLICWAISEGLCSRLSLATAMGWSISKLNMTLINHLPCFPIITKTKIFVMKHFGSGKTVM